MKHLLVFLAFATGAAAPVFSQKADLSTIDGIVQAMYSSISGPAGDRDWDFFRSLFTENAAMGAIYLSGEGSPVYNPASPEMYISNNAPYFKQNGFWEKELNRSTARFGELAHVMSTYEFEMERGGEVIKQRGVNSIQLIYQNNRWYIASLQWNGERQDLPLDKLSFSSEDQ